MSIRSMTGYGTAAAESPLVRASVSVRSVNHRYLDLTVHLSRRVQALEADVKKAVQQRITRGRVEVSLQATVKEEAGDVLVAPRPLIGALVKALRQVQAEHGLAGEVQVSDVARFPGALEVVEPSSEIDEGRRRELLDLLARALDGLEGMRAAEGTHLQDDLDAGLGFIAAATQRLESLSEEGRAQRREMLREKARALVQELGLEEPRLYQEVVRLVDRSDVAEEVQRLRSHVHQAREALLGDAPCGKRLDFLAQEMAREANTIGSKAASAPLVQEVVALKSEIERLREQVQNVE